MVTTWHKKLPGWSSKWPGTASRPHPGTPTHRHFYPVYKHYCMLDINIYNTDFFPYLNVTLIMIIMQYNHVMINDIMLKYMFMCHVPVNQQLSVLHNISSVTTVKPENEKQYSWIDFHSCLFYIPSFLDD